MPILKNNLKEKYTKIPNEIILATISNESFRLLVYLYSKPNDWRIYQSKIAEEFNVTRQTINKRFKELKDASLVDITKVATQKGTFEYQYILLNSTVSKVTDTVESLQRVSSLTDTVPNGHGSNFTHTNTNLNQDYINTNTIFSNEKVQKTFNEFMKMRKRIKKPLNDPTALINKLNKYSDEVKIIALENSIEMEYQGVFPDKYVQKKKSEHENKMKGLMNA